LSFALKPNLVGCYLKRFLKTADNLRMDLRLDERYQTNLEVKVTDIAAPERIAIGELIDISESGVCANLSMRLEPGAIVKAYTGDCTLFGHVVYCDGDPIFRTGIEVVRVLIGESDLARLVRAILLENMPATPGVASH
jgi:hypothetical protein